MSDDHTEVGRPARILLVEDHWLLAMDLAKQLEDFGYEIVGPAPCIEKAMSLIRHEFIDAGLLDINLENSSCYPAAVALMQRGIPFAFITSQSSVDLRPDFQKHLLVSKPVSSTALLEVVRNMIG
jgi:CheY-like chemotaxis protein